MDKIYTCPCGREFNNPQSFNAHKSHCIKVIGKDGVVKRNAQAKKASNIANQKRQISAQIKKDEDLRQWISEQHTCEKCGRVMTEKYGSGRFCCKACANSHQHSKETKLKQSESVKNYLIKNGITSTASKNKYYRGYYNNIWFDSSYELIYYLYCIDHNISIIRNRKESFKYIFENQEKLYFPDFYLPDTSTYIELKGFTEFYNSDIVELKSKSVLIQGFNYELITDISMYQKYIENKYNLKGVKEICNKFYI